MDQLDFAIQDTVLNNAKTPQELADSIGMSHQILLNKANPENDRNKFNIREVVMIIRHSGNISILRVMADKVGYILRKQPETQEKCLLEGVLTVAIEHGDIGNEIQKGLHNGTLSPRAKGYVRQEIEECMSALDQLRAAL